MSKSNDVNTNWQDIVSSIPKPLNAHFLGSKAEIDTSGLIVYLPSQQANIEQISRQIEPKYIRGKVTNLFGDVAISYQVSLPAMPQPREVIRVRDKRKKQPFFMVENSLYREGHAARMKANGVLVYLCLVMHVDDESKCWPSYQTIAKLVGTSRRNVIRTCGKLVELGYIEIEKVFNDKGECMSNNFFILELPNV